MRHFLLPIGIICGLLGTSAPAAAVPATYVSATGNDAAACSVTAPCKTLQAAHNKTDPGGVITVLSSGDFGPVKISQSISIVADGVTALIRNGIACGGETAAICIAAGASGVVHLRGLTVSTAAQGIRLTSGAALRVQNSLFQGASTGIFFQPGSASELYVSDTSLANNGFGIVVAPLAHGSAEVSIDRLNAEGNSKAGIRVFYSAPGSGQVVAAVRDSFIAGSLDGIHVTTGNAHTIAATIDRTALFDNGNGIRAIGRGATIRFVNSTVTDNTNGIFGASGAEIIRYPNNVVEGNADDDPSALNPISQRGGR